MDPKFQTSFIPKKNAPNIGNSAIHVTIPRKGTSAYMVIAVILFIISLGCIGGAYGWQKYLISTQNDYKTELANSEKQFNLDLIEQLKQANFQIDTAKQILTNHIAMSNLFDFIQRLTVQSIRFNDFDVISNAADGIKVTMNGTGANLPAVAFQSDVLGQLEQYGLRKVVKNPILANPTLDPKGTVSFSFTATIDPASVSYAKLVTGASSDTASTTP